MLADMVSPGGIVADVGCDHGYLSIWLVQTGTCAGALAMDVRKGPLGAAAEHVKECRLEGYIETRLSDGLQSMEAGEADTLVLAGMGGRLMSRILTEGEDKLKAFRELILQPQSELMEFRRFLRRMGLETVQEAAVAEEGKYYFAMKAVWPEPGRETAAGEPAADRSQAADEGLTAGREQTPDRSQAADESRAADGKQAPNREQAAAGGLTAGREQAPDRSRAADRGPTEQEARVWDKYGRGLIRQGNPVLLEYLRREKGKLEEIAGQLSGADSPGQQVRYRELVEEIRDVEYALGLMKQNIDTERADGEDWNGYSHC